MINDFKKYLPEACYEVQNLSLQDVEEAFCKNETVAGFVESIDETLQELSVRLGDNINASLPFDEATIYPFTYFQNPAFHLPKQIAFLNGKVICAKVKSIDNQKVTLSRKDNMLAAFEVISKESFLPFKVTSAQTHNVFGDVGHGILSRIHISNLCLARIHSTTEVVNNGDSFFVKVIDFDESKRANVSYKATFEPYDPLKYHFGDMLVGRITEPVDDKFTGFFVNISPQVCGIVDYMPWQPILKYGDNVECLVIRATQKGLHLKLIKKFESKTV